jgi:cell division protein FtsI (penicillin-binding protein 3)
MKDVRKDILWRVYLVYLSVLFFSFFIVAQIIHIQFVEGDTWKKRSDMQTLDTMKVEAIRGNICADDGSLLATSVPIFDIYWDAKVVDDETFNEKADSLALCLANFFKDKSRYEYKKILSSARVEGKEYVPLHKSYLNDESTQITFDDLKKIKSFPIFKLGKVKSGLIIEQKEKRVMPYQLLAKRTIGYERGGAFVGLEGAYTKRLEGTSGIRLRKKIAGGVWMPMNENEIEPQNGSDIITSIDKNIQDVAENSLMKNLILNNADHGCVILMEVQTGYIKAIANLTRVSEGVYDEKYNYAIGEATEPGSTFKLFSLVAAMDDGMVNLDNMVAIGKTKYFDREMKDSHIKGYGPETVRQAFEESSNVGISQAIFKAYKNNPQRFTDKLYSMRINQPLGLDIGGEDTPVVKNPKSRSWSRVTLPWMAVGYEVALTPMQILAFYNAIANNGKLVKPLFVKEIQKMGKVVDTFKTIVLKDSICSKATVEKARSLLEGVVLRGTGKSLKNPIYKIAGKTGTAQVAKGSKGYGEEGAINYKASFVGYFPADNPKYSCIVVVNNPSKGAYYGGAVAAPVFKDIADKIFATHMDMEQQKDSTVYDPSIPFVKASNQKDLFAIYKVLDFSTLSQNPSADWVYLSVDTKNVLMKEKPFKYGYVPDVTGMGLKDAIYLLESVGLKVNISGKGKVMSQSLAAGTAVKKGNTIYLQLSRTSAFEEIALQEIPEDTDSTKTAGNLNAARKDTKSQTLKGKTIADKNKKTTVPDKNKNKATEKPKSTPVKDKTNNTATIKPKDTKNNKTN